MSDKTDSKPAESKRRIKDNEMSDAPEKELTATEEEKLQDEFEAEQQKQAPILTVAELKFTAGLTDIPSSAKQDAQNRLLSLIKEHKMTAYYKKCCVDLKLPEDAKLVAELKEANDKGLKDLDAKIEDAKKNLGETEVRDALMARADYLALIGEKELAIKAYEETLEKTVGSGGRIDVELAVLRLGLCWNDMDLLKNHLVKAKDFVEKGGDWERKNLLAVYEATYLIMIREFKDAAKLLLDSVATFTCYRLFSYNSFIFYAVAAAVVSLNRISLRDKVVKNPDILSVVHEVPHLKPFVNALYDCHYGQFFKSLAEITDALKRDRYWSTHAGYFMRECRIVAYAQFLESYKSVTLISMADAFGVTVPFLDRELSRFIAAGRLNCKVDKVGGIVETNRPDARNTQYAALIKQGDVLLNRIQKLSKVINF